MTKTELIYTVFEKLKITSDDSPITQELVATLIDAARATLVHQKYSEKGWSIPVTIKQELCLSLTPVASIFGATCFGTILRTKDIIPKGISFRGFEGAVIKVKTYDRKALEINFVDIDRLPYVGQTMFTRGLIYAAIDVDRRLYFVSGTDKHKLLEAIKIEGVYEYPDGVHELMCNENTTDDPANRTIDTTQIYEPWDKEYPLELSMQVMVVDMVAKGLLETIALPSDSDNDATDDRDADKE